MRFTIQFEKESKESDTELDDDENSEDDYVIAR